LLRPNDPAALAQRGFALIKKGHIEAALADLDKAISLNPAEAWFYAWRGSANSWTNDIEKALADFKRALELNPKEAGFYALRGSVYGKKHDYIKAAADFGQAILLNPGSPEACNNLAWLRATCPEASLRDGKEAVELATRACDQTGYKIQSLVDTLAAAYAETDDFENAVKYEKLSLGLISATPQNRPAMEERLALYEHRKPFRQKPNP